jgi:[protein-PII] uridylyltransferase
VTDLLGGKLESRTRLATLERRLVEAATNTAGELLDVNSFAMSS